MKIFNPYVLHFKTTCNPFLHGKKLVENHHQPLQSDLDNIFFDFWRQDMEFPRGNRICNMLRHTLNDN